MALRKIKRIKSSSFLGRQLSRLKMGQSYYAIITSTISAISLASLAFQLDLWFIFLIFPIFLVITFIIGYYLDIRNIKTMDSLKSIEMTQRFLNTSDIKNQEFHLMLTSVLITAIKQGKEIDPEILLEKYEEYKKKWKSYIA